MRGVAQEQQTAVPVARAISAWNEYTTARITSMSSRPDPGAQQPPDARLRAPSRSAVFAGHQHELPAPVLARARG